MMKLTPSQKVLVRELIKSMSTNIAELEAIAVNVGGLKYIDLQGQISAYESVVDTLKTALRTGEWNGYIPLPK